MTRPNNTIEKCIKFDDIFAAWINQPSTLQPYHKYHGRNVWVHNDNGKLTAAFLDENITIPIDRLALSVGWH